MNTTSLRAQMEDLEGVGTERALREEELTADLLKEGTMDEERSMTDKEVMRDPTPWMVEEGSESAGTVIGVQESIAFLQFLPLVLAVELDGSELKMRNVTLVTLVNRTVITDKYVLKLQLTCMKVNILFRVKHIAA
ncbi:hypothetical protein NDU88_003299 [Pleurodeles waltl]|uniref:Uncharacterized protein n=1 Tax=Pleurodeles waltl TaxID=8319 RepID=A0AAV7SEC5_PLEWA|nr:hypothetical protein NDU88_003299 [Pleurodeles waltl]